MLDKLIDFILNQIKSIVPIAVVFQFQSGVLYRFGRFKRSLSPGWYLKIPYVDAVAVENVTDTTILLPAQSINTADEQQIIVRAAVGYKISDIVKYFNNGYDIRSLISDNACLTLRQQIAWKDYDAVVELEFGVVLRVLLQKEVNKYGVKINFVGLIDITKSRSFRLFNETLKLES